jgi:DNA/RNA endonuclease G (NUC1)
MTRRQCLKQTVLATSAVVFPQSQIDAKNADSESAPFMAPTLPIHVFRPNDYMEIAFDTRTRTPIYVMERLKGLSGNDPPTKRRARFHEEPSLPEEFRSRNGQYRGSGFDRGHMAPAADFRHYPSFIKDTYTLCNAVPQVPSMNRSWARLEAFVRKVAEREWKENQATTYIVTGPLWLPSSISKEGVFQYTYSGIGSPPALVSVPTHLFKVIAVVQNEDTVQKFAAFVMPNEEMKGGHLDLYQYIVRLSDLEAVTGMHFFPNMHAFRRSVNAVTERVLPKLTHGRPVLLLTEGDSKQSGTSKIESCRSSRKGDVLCHLCEEGMCQ